jgi:hypothetical protein
MLNNKFTKLWRLISHEIKIKFHFAIRPGTCMGWTTFQHSNAPTPFLDIYAIDTRSRKGQRLRGELLLNLKEGAGLSYKEIAEIEIFKNLKFSTLRSMYRNMKQKRSR